MKLSIAVFTRNHADWLPRILPQFQRVADELVVVVNSSTRDNSAEVARRYTDRVVLVPHEVVPERQTARIVAACNSDWILALLDDETLSSHWENRVFVDRLLADRYATHYWIPRRWLIPPGDKFIANSRWYPDFQMRLFRNIPSLLAFPNSLHSSVNVAGEPRYLAEAWILHWDLVWRDRRAREEKLVEYGAASARTLPEFYLYEEEQFETRPAAADVVPAGGDTCATPPPETADERYQVGISALDLPKRMKAGQDYAVCCAITNHSTRVLHPESRRLQPELIWLSYHWFAGDGMQSNAAKWENPRHDLPARIPPGETALRILPVHAPEHPGDYLLQFDLVEEGVAWFSEFSASAKHIVSVLR